MYCSQCGEKQKEDAIYCFDCGSKLNGESKNRTSNFIYQKDIPKFIKKRTWLKIAFITEYLSIFFVLWMQNNVLYYDANFITYGLFQVIAIISAIVIMILVYKISSELRKPTYLIIIYTVISPIFLLSLISIVAVLVDSKKVIRDSSKAW